MIDAGTIADFSAFEFKQKIAGKTVAGSTKNVKIMVPLKYLSNVLRKLEMSLINCEINITLTWSEKYVLFNHTKATPFAITDTKTFMLQLYLYQLKIMQKIMSLINCEINLILTWSEKYVLSNHTKATTFAITDTKLFMFQL